MRYLFRYVTKNKMTSSACFVGSGLNLIFYWKTQLLQISKSLSTSFADAYGEAFCKTIYVNQKQ